MKASCRAEDAVPGSPCVSACGRLGVVLRSKWGGGLACWGKGVLAEVSCSLCLRIPRVLPVQ